MRAAEDPLAVELGDAVVLLVAPLALPGEERVVAVPVERPAGEGVPGLQLVVEALERERAVERLDPEGELGRLDGERVEVDAVEAALDDVALQAREEARLEVGVVGEAWEKLLDEAAGGRDPLGKRDDDARPGAVRATRAWWWSEA